MDYKLINCDSLLKKITRKDNLFNGKYCIDPYQNCEFGCLYCDSSYDKTIFVKENADDILNNELKKVKKGLIIIGSVHDPYQNAEKTYEITKKILKIIKKYNLPCHILTKSNLILRDLDILNTIDCTVTISILSLNEKISSLFEKNVISTKHRFNLVDTLSKNKIKAGIAQIPILPYITSKEIESIIKISKKYNAQYFLYKYLELKGEQKQIFLDLIKKYFPEHLTKYKTIYNNSIKPELKYTKEIDIKIQKYCKKYDIANFIK